LISATQTSISSRNVSEVSTPLMLIILAAVAVATIAKTTAVAFNLRRTKPNQQQGGEETYATAHVVASGMTV
jgi:hypothetical protein